MDITIRWAEDRDWPAAAQVDARNFGFQYSEQDLEDDKLILDRRRFLVAEDAGRVVGLTGDFPLKMTVPGGASVPIAGVTWVSVAATHRRRGVLTALMAEQHHAFLAQGYAVAALGASESGIYGRFGYGQATVRRRIEVDRRHAQVRRDLPESGAVRMVDHAEARPLVPALHARWAAVTPGAISRSDGWWDFLFLDREHQRRGAGPLFFAVHPDGYVAYRIRPAWNEGFPAHVVEVVDQFAATPGAAIDLWRFLLSIDLAGPIRTLHAPPGDPLPFLLDHSRQARTLGLGDGLWVRLLDIPVALAARTYAIEGSLVLDVQDPFLDLGGRFRLTANAGGVSCAPTGDEADLMLGVGALGALYLGGHAPSTLAAAGLIAEATPGALARADLLFVSARPPHAGTDF